MSNIRVSDVIDFYTHTYRTVWAVLIDDVVYDPNDIPLSELRKDVDYTCVYELSFDVARIDIHTKS